MKNAKANTTEEFARTQGYLAAKKAMTKQSALVMVCASAALTVFFLLRIIVASATGKKDALFACFYYFMGDSSVPFVNLGAGLLVFIFMFMTTCALVGAYLGAKSDDRDKIHNSLGFLQGTLAYALVLTFVFILISLCSVSVLYQASRIPHLQEYATVGGINHGWLFFNTVVFGVVIVTTIICLIRYVSSLKKAADGICLNTNGTIVTIVVSFICTLVYFVVFFLSLGNLVMPIDVGETIQFSYVGAAAADVLISAAITTIAACAGFITISYHSGVSEVSRMVNASYYRAAAGYAGAQTVNTTAEDVKTE